jgi:hypothetical protein
MNDPLKLQLVGNQQATSQYHRIACMVQWRHYQHQQLVGRSRCQKDQRLRHISPTHIGIPWSITFSAHVHHILVTFNVDSSRRRAVGFPFGHYGGLPSGCQQKGFFEEWLAIKGFSQKNIRSFAASWNVSQGPRLILFVLKVRKDRLLRRIQEGFTTIWQSHNAGSTWLKIKRCYDCLDVMMMS